MGRVGVRNHRSGVSHLLASVGIVVLLGANACGDPCAERDACAAPLGTHELAGDGGWLEGEVGPARVGEEQPAAVRAWRDRRGTHAALVTGDGESVRVVLTLRGGHDHPDLAAGTARTWYLEDDVALGGDVRPAFVTARARTAVADAVWEDHALDVALTVEHEEAGLRYQFLATFVDDRGDLRLASGAFDLTLP